MSDSAPGVSSLGFDNWMRAHFRASTPEGRAFYDGFSHVGQVVNLGTVLTLDIYKGVEKDDWKVAMLGIGVDLGVIGGGFLLNHFALKPGFRSLGVLNDRPMYDECIKDPSYDSYCTNGELHTGMPSDDSYLAAAGAGSALANVVSDPVLRKKAWLVALVAGGGLVSTLSTNLGRIGADKHWTSETLTGDAVGYAIGFGGGMLTRHFLPNLSLSPTVSKTELGLSISGTW